MSRIGIALKNGRVIKINTNIENLEISIIDLDLDSYYESELRDREVVGCKKGSLKELRAMMRI